MLYNIHISFYSEKVGMKFFLKEAPGKYVANQYIKQFIATIQQNELLKVVQDLNADPQVHGLIVQLPLPSHINEKEILDAVRYVPPHCTMALTSIKLREGH
jgi:5,10-methylene-tetrahydrofolate dehydrogenase/methenyl tetrahydrofolate cyclohydrolase